MGVGVEISRLVYGQIRRHGEASYPRESCGILAGRGNGVVVWAYAAENSTDGETASRYSIAPVEVVRAIKAARVGGLEVVGFYHSHPDCAADWSATDLREAHWLGCWYVITEVSGGWAGETKCFRLEGIGEGGQAVCGGGGGGG